MSFPSFGAGIQGPKPPPNGIYHIKNPKTPEFRFEWHSTTKKVYLIELGRTIQHEGQTKHEANVIAEHADNHGVAIGFVQTWLRGYRHGISFATTNPQLASSVVLAG